MATDADIASALVGTTLRDGRYAVCGVLGEGSQGATLDAVDKRDGKPVAIKRFQVRGAQSWMDVELAEREARVLSKLSHRLLPEALDHFEEDGALYLVMEKIEGATLDSLGTVDEAEVICFLHDAAAVLDYLHGRAPTVIHRDIKPRNVIRRPAREGEARASFVLVDFGSVRDSLKPAGGSTVVGTFGYMAPEQFQGRAMPCSDVYAVGVTALRMLTGVEPEDLPHKGLGIDVASSLSGRAPSLVSALKKMVQPDPDLRASSITPLLASLADAAPRPPPEHVARAATPNPREPKSSEPSPPERGPAEPAPGSTVTPAAPSLPPLAAALMRLGLAIAHIAIWASMQLAVPLVLTLLSLLFGKPLRNAARAVTKAGIQARQGVAGAQRWLATGTTARRAARRQSRRQRREERRQRRRGRGRQPEEVQPTPKAAARIDPAAGEPKRIDEEIDDTLAEFEEAIGEALEEVDELRKRR
jgi:hypothetical protein